MNPCRLTLRTAFISEDLSVKVLLDTHTFLRTGGEPDKLSPRARDVCARESRTLAGVSILPVHYRHALAAAALPMRHKDPFDRMLAAQCLAEGLPCVTRDPAFAEYGVEAIW